MSNIDTALQRLQVLALASSSSDITVKHAPNYPIDNANLLPMAIAHVGSGEGTAHNATQLTAITNLYVDLHVNRVSLTNAFKQIDAFVPLFRVRLAGDPTLNGSVDTINFPILWSDPAPVEYDQIVTLMVRFTVPVKTLETPVST